MGWRARLGWSAWITAVIAIFGGLFSHHLEFTALGVVLGVATAYFATTKIRCPQCGFLHIHIGMRSDYCSKCGAELRDPPPPP